MQDWVGIKQESAKEDYEFFSCSRDIGVRSGDSVWHAINPQVIKAHFFDYCKELLKGSQLLNNSSFDKDGGAVISTSNKVGYLNWKEDGTIEYNLMEDIWNEIKFQLVKCSNGKHIFSRLLRITNMDSDSPKSRASQVKDLMRHLKYFEDHSSCKFISAKDLLLSSNNSPYSIPELANTTVSYLSDKITKLASYTLHQYNDATTPYIPEQYNSTTSYVDNNGNNIPHLILNTTNNATLLNDINTNYDPSAGALDLRSGIIISAVIILGVILFSACIISTVIFFSKKAASSNKNKAENIKYSKISDSYKEAIEINDLESTSFPMIREKTTD